nr:MAG TPA: hypothetical protein [Caudoviricetes sp.]
MSPFQLNESKSNSISIRHPCISVLKLSSPAFYFPLYS